MFDELPLAEVSFSAGVAGAIVLLAVVDRRRSRDLLLLVAGATAAILVGLEHAPRTLLLAVAVTVVASVVDDSGARTGLLALGLAGLVSAETAGLSDGLRAGSLVTAAALAPLLWSSHLNSGLVVVVVVIAGTAVGVYVNVPDTEQIAVVAPGLAVLAGAMLLLPPVRRTSVWFGSLATVGALVVWAGAVGARGRPAAFIGLVGALGVLVAEPVAARLRRGTHANPIALVAVHAAAVIVSSRVAGLRGSSAAAAAIVVAVLAGSVVLLVLLPRVASRPLPAQ